jgi:hypothetical protein
VHAGGASGDGKPKDKKRCVSVVGRRREKQEIRKEKIKRRRRKGIGK